MLSQMAGTVIVLGVGVLAFLAGLLVGFASQEGERKRLRRSQAKERRRLLREWLEEYGCYECQEKVKGY